MSARRCRPEDEDVLDVLGLLVVELAEHPLPQHLGEADDRVERRAELVGHVREELGLVAAGRLELPALVLELAEEAGVLDGDRRLGGERLEEIDDLGGEARRGSSGSPRGRPGRAPRGPGAPPAPRGGRIAPSRRAAGSRRRPCSPMSGISTGCRVTPARPTAPSPMGIGAERSDLDELRVEALRRAQVEHALRLVVLVDAAAVGAGQEVGARHDGRQHRLEVERRADRLADRAERLELLDGPRQVLRARLQLLEQPRVLDRDDRLAGEGRRRAGSACP